MVIKRQGLGFRHIKLGYYLNKKLSLEFGGVWVRKSGESICMEIVFKVIVLTNTP